MKEIVPLLDKKHEARVAKDKDFQYLAEDIALVKKQRKENSISLNEAVRRKERDQQEARAKLREARLLSNTPGADDPILVPDPKEALKTPLAPSRPTPRPKWRRSRRAAHRRRPARRRAFADRRAGSGKAAKAAKDVLLNEAVHILADEVAVLKTDTRMASRVLPYAADTK
jgi:carboxyl-terminal processing protease